MNQTVYFKIIIVLLLVSMASPLEAKLQKPSKNGEEKEILIINSKRRVYYPINEDGLTYSIDGPSRIEFISRYPVIRKKKQSHSFQYKIIVDGVDTVIVNHRYKIQKSIKSIQHPKHSYTYSGNYNINLNKGNHSIELLPGQDLKYPTLIRVLSKEFESLGKDLELLIPLIHQSAVNIISNKKELIYYECTSKLPLQVEVNGKKKLRIMSRLEFSESMGQEESYRIRVREGKKVIGTYYFNTERSSESQIKNRPNLVPGKWRSCEISVPKNKHTYSVEVADKGKTILTRFIQY
ncbi:MAG: hypothetical protein HN674_08165 [Candidatus Marinimicrobia bacterium]|jgi:hypothetical protein|nr:hypothetical protein [Candidatus Neomarinimicrobiota bacterium]MBT3502492.1 hypothetical protein [Candidatus Neomarinimicrobiota bacterium]MBT3839093.1 hypothetical protein [Candidatus Neomarinimicrobiota bacterium]MBT3999842.1 hypothetical protein [Candidatus Neomarinimicrobiota bacterium]MBT4580417.1 hypothetical protein [Candidatus Neomarinimicrobiota bacterium]